MPGIKYDVGYRTNLAKRRIQEHVNLVELQATDPDRTRRTAINECIACYYVTRVAGQAFTGYICEICNKLNMHSNTAVPRLCSSCASKHNICCRCGADRELDETRKELLEPISQVSEN